MGRTSKAGAITYCCFAVTRRTWFFLVVVGVVDEDVEHQAPEEFVHLGPMEASVTVEPKQQGQVRIGQLCARGLQGNVG
jgi:hypothetical protein